MKTNELSTIDRNLSTAFDAFFRPWNEWFGNGNNWNRPFTLPSVNISETDKAYMLELMAPGLQKQDFNVDVNENMLTISSEHEEKEEETSKKFTKKEYRHSSFSRSFLLPDAIEKGSIEASYSDGVLRVSIPKNGNTKKEPEKRIEIR